MLRAWVRKIVTTLRGRVPCGVSMCGRPGDHGGFCWAHLRVMRYQRQRAAS